MISDTTMILSETSKFWLATDCYLQPCNLISIIHSSLVILIGLSFTHFGAC